MSARLLVVDDEAGIRESLGKILRYEGFTVETAPDGPTALALAGRQAFDLVFLDIKMPGMDGLEVLTRLAEGGLTLPVVIISGHGTVETAVQATKLGAFDFLEKPLDADRVLVTLRNALAWRHESGTGLDPEVWGVMLDLVYSDRVQEAADFLKAVWPAGRAGRTDFMNEFADYVLTTWFGSRLPWAYQLQPWLPTAKE